MGIDSYIYTSEANCQHCYKCLRNCFVKTIKFERNKSAILEDKCILCGKCLEICPQNAKSYLKDTDKIPAFFNQPFLVSLAPSFFSHFDQPYKIVAFLKSNGALVVQETAIGADIVSSKYKELMNQTNKTIITTACPVVVELAQMHYPEVLEYLTPFLSPMNTHALFLKNSYENIPLIFIGPCFAKKKEGKGFYDLIITFEELDEFLKLNNLNLAEYEDALTTPPYPNRGKIFPISGGVNYSINGDWIQHMVVEGIENLDKVFRDFYSLKKGFFIEASACFGSCIAGKGIRKDLSHIEKRERLLHFTERNKEREQLIFDSKLVNLDISRAFSSRIEEDVFDEEKILEVLRSTGKKNIKDELDCGACGYDSCRDKAKAVLSGKAEKEMCLPYMMKKAASLSNIVIENFPNIVVIYDKQLRLLYLNPAAESLFAGEEDVLSDIVAEIEQNYNLSSIEKVINKRKFIFFCKTFDIPEEDSKVLMLIDITQEQLREEKVKGLERQAMQKIEEVINKQMHLAQNIASILGESVAETKSHFQEFKTYLDKDDVKL